jgi:invasion protein IalB
MRRRTLWAHSFRANRAPAALVAAVALATATVSGLAAEQPSAEHPSREATPARTPAAPAPAADSAQQEMKFFYFPWTKLCGKDDSGITNGEDMCVAAIEEYTETGQLALMVSLIELKDSTRKILRVALPLGVQLKRGTRVIIDEDAPQQRVYLMCLEASGCVSDYEFDSAIVEKLKKAHSLMVQAINPAGQPMSIPVPLKEFAAAHDGPPTPPQVLEERRKEFQEDLQRKVEAHEKPENSPPRAAQPASPAAGAASNRH